jgi:hypothetical protein
VKYDAVIFDLNRFTGSPHPEEHAVGVRLEGWATGRVLVPILRDAALGAAPQDEARGGSISS